MTKLGFVYFNGEEVTYTSTRPFSGSRSFIQEDVTHPVFQDASQWIVRDGELIKKDELKKSDLRVVMISDYGINCGIATYTKYLCDAMRGTVWNLHIVAEDADLPEEVGVTRCWRRGEDYSRILPVVEKLNPDIIFIQHEFGLFPEFGQWNCLLSQLSRWRTVTVLHTVLDHRVGNEEAALDYRCRALAEAACPEVIVHTPKARECLRARGYSGVVHFIPHGCFSPQAVPRLPVSKYGMLSSRHTIFQYGFGGRHKGWEFAIDTVEKLVPKYQDLLYVGFFNLSPFGGSEQIQYHKSLLDLVKSKSLEKHISIHRGFQSEEMLSNFIRSSRVGFFPYQRPNAHWASWGASGAIQLPLSLGLPLVLGDFPAFQEFSGQFPLVSNPTEAAEAIDRIFSDPDYEKKLQQNALKHAQERSWDKIARYYLTCSPKRDFNV